MDFVTRAFNALQMEPIFQNHSTDQTRFGCQGRCQIRFAELNAALEDFESQPLRKRLKMLRTVGLDVIKLGIAIAKVRRVM